VVVDLVLGGGVGLGVVDLVLGGGVGLCVGLGGILLGGLGTIEFVARADWEGNLNWKSNLEEERSN